MWRKTLVYLGLVEEPDEYDEMPERFEEQARAARPAMHDSTGPIAVVRPDQEEDFGLGAVAARASGDGGGRRGAPQDPTEPVRSVGPDAAGSGAFTGSGGDRRPRERSGDDRREPDPRGADRRGADRRGTQQGAERDSNVRALRPDDTDTASAPSGLGRRVAIVAVTDYEESAREVGTRFRQGSPVVFDLTDAPTDARKRVLDFVAGTIFALNGEMLKVGGKSFLVVPRGTEIPEREWMRLETLGYRP